ncbi:MAG: PQQ-dependent sugar dehydrogenase [Bacteroidia bacterium]|nr:PQQ-dependent sugar dehydrogenase [Bacteroidia bacterium]NND09988.1 PQQ-dependent sugar dehydrogenase [Flavobacteriaceae bacterium]MBT8310979.1 PQQ-dependent sugar dehydrogenase [Bacteroidia bacterium]NNK28559.1 PQQ-dependent sugar dehydrogenase [Flavobacteriaceae bacterium]NNL60722.1 PQQ-dependent sugar dehydrogenase [Flavobacteriaceae bacterium]
MLSKSSKFIALYITLFSLSSCGQSKENDIEITTSQESKYTTEVIVPDLKIPWGMVFLPDGSMLITEKSGELIHFKEGIKTKIPNPPKVSARGQGGFLDLELHPNYEENGWIYMSYSSPEGEGQGANTAVARAKLKNGLLVDQEVLYKAEPNSTRGHHFGSRLEFDNEGYLYFTIGDRGNRDVNPQDITRDCGKVYRIHDDGRIPKDNPFVDDPNAKHAIYSYGHRNQQGMVKHPESGKIIVHEHGPRGGDEINVIEKGKNYGWPVITYGINYSGTVITYKKEAEGMEQPMYYWIPSIAPSGMDYVTSDKYPEWKGNLLVGSLVFQYLERLEIKNDEVVAREKLFDGIGRLRNVRQGPDGYIYMAVENAGILRIVPKK